jgi:ligand-binding sensor domain-containing protein
MGFGIQPTYYTNTNYIYDITGQDSVIYCATNGGFLAFNRITGDFTSLTNTDGLQLNKQNAVAVDSSGHIWIGNELGLALVNKDLGSISIYPVECLTCTRTQTIACSRDSIYVGSSNGLLFIDTKGTPLDFNDDTQVKIFELPCNSIRSIATDDTSLWVGTTTAGVVRLSKDLLTMQNYTTDHGLLNNEINRLRLIDSKLYACTDDGLNRFATDHFDTILTSHEVNDISHLGDSLILALDQEQQAGILDTTSSTVTIMKNGLPWRSKVLCMLNLQGALHCGLGNRYTKEYYGDGIGLYNPANNTWSIDKNQCIPSNHISEITANDHGIFVACGNRAGESRGFGWLNNQGDWINYSRDSILPSNTPVIPSNHVHRCVTAPDGKVWFGYNSFPDVDTSIMAFSFDAQYDAWLFIPNRYNGMEGCEAVWDIEFDQRSNMYLSLAGPTDKLWLIDSALDVVYFLDPQFSVFTVEIALDSAGKIWRTHTDAGLSRTDTKNTLFNRNDDEYRNFTTADGLISNYMRGCVVDADNVLYAATDAGLVIYDGQTFANRADISDAELLDLEIDSQGRIWIMARDGVYYLEPFSGNIASWRFSEYNIGISFLESIGEMIQVQGFEFDPLRNCFWVGGETGLLRLSVQYDSMPEIGAAHIYPNPVTKGILRIKDIPQDAQVDIYSLSGRRVAEDLTPDSVFGEIIWEIPDDIPSGLYVALVKSERGNNTYKFAIAR